MTRICNPPAVTKDGWYAKHTGEDKLWGPVKNIRTAVQTWPNAIYQRVEEGVVVATVDMRPTFPSTPPRYDEALLRKHLSAMPLGKYHSREDAIGCLCLDGVPMFRLQGRPADTAALTKAEGLVAALVHLLNNREQTEIPR